LIAFAMAWSAAVSGAVYVFQPFGRYWYSGEWLRFAVLWIGPIALLVIGVPLWNWVQGGKRART
jgi:signal transduction histidine kinase